MPKKNSNKFEQRQFAVVKSNALIQKTRYSLSTQEQKIILYLLTKIMPGDDDFKLYEFAIQDFCTVCGICSDSGKNYTDLKAAIKKLSDKSLWVKLDNGRETLVRWIEKPYIDEGSGVISIKLDRDMKPYLLDLKEHFTTYQVYYILAMKSRYSIRLYELLKSYEYINKKEFDLAELKVLLDAEKYHRNPDFIRRVLDPAVKEINVLGDIWVAYTLHKRGRAYRNILFTIKAKKDMKDRLDVWNKIEQSLDTASKGEKAEQVSLFQAKTV